MHVEEEEEYRESSFPLELLSVSSRFLAQSSVRSTRIAVQSLKVPYCAQFQIFIFHL